LSACAGTDDKQPIKAASATVNSIPPVFPYRAVVRVLEAFIALSFVVIPDRGSHSFFVVAGDDQVLLFP
jgi:hypothetical protein